MNSAMLRFYFAIVLLVLLLFFSLNQLYSLMYQRNDIVVAAQSILQQAYQHDKDSKLRLSCRISDTEDCPDSLFITYPAGMWQPLAGFDYQLEIMRDSQGNASLCGAMPDNELLCMNQLNLPQNLDSMNARCGIVSRTGFRLSPAARAMIETLVTVDKQSISVAV